MAKQVATLVREYIGKLVHDGGMTQGQIAELLEVSPAMVSLLKNKKVKSELIVQNGYKESLEKIAADAGLDVEDDEEDKETEGEAEVEKDAQYGSWLLEKTQELKMSIPELARKTGLSYVGLKRIIDGVTINPQAATRKKLQEALNEAAKNTVVQVDQPPIVEPDADDMTIGLLYKDQEINQTPNKKGVYVIHDRRGYPTYIGKGNIRSRLQKHSGYRAFLDNRVAYSFSYLVLQKGESPEEVKRADGEARRLERIITKFCGNTVLLNKQLAEDLSDE